MLGVGLAVLGALANVFIVVVLTLYFLSSLAAKKASTGSPPLRRRDRVTKLGDRVLEGVGGYVSGAFIVAMCAGLTR